MLVAGAQCITSCLTKYFLIPQDIVKFGREKGIEISGVGILPIDTMPDPVRMFQDPNSPEGEAVRKTCREAFEFIKSQGARVSGRRARAWSAAPALLCHATVTLSRFQLRSDERG